MNTLLLTLIVIYAILVLNTKKIDARPSNPENDIVKTEIKPQMKPEMKPEIKPEMNPGRIRHSKMKFLKNPKYRFKYSEEPEGLATDFENYSIQLYQSFRVTMHNLEREFHKDLMKFRKYNRNIFKI